MNLIKVLALSSENFKGSIVDNKYRRFIHPPFFCERQLKVEPVKPVSKPRMPNMGFEGIAEHVLGLITTREMTSRDIQITIGRSREHTSRLMKRLFQEGYVERNNKTKPFTYRITEKGKAKISTTEQPIPA